MDEFIIRGRHPPDSRYDDVGFRCARAVQRKRMGASAAAAPPAAPAPAAPPVPVPSTAPSGGCPFNMVEVPGGTFTMGAKDGRDDERPVHQVTLDAFCLDVAPVTVAAYARCSTCAPRKKNPDCNEPGKGNDDHPQNCVSWDEAAAYCKAQGKKLPTEAQFEYAARGGAENREWSLGSAPTRTTACVDRMGGPDDFGTCPAGAHPAGAFGLSDMAGNVWEWMADWYALYPSAPQKNPTGPSSPGMNSLRVLRGGAWTNVRGDELRSHLRGDGYADFHGGADIGFRCAKERGTR